MPSKKLTCARCGEQFYGRAGSLYCSTRCRVAAFNARKREEQSKHSAAYIRAEVDLKSVMRSLRKVFNDVEPGGFTDDETELIVDSIRRVRARLDELKAAL